MKLENKRSLAARTLNVGKGKIVFNVQRLSEIKEAITKQDIKDLKTSGAISVKEEKGRKKARKRRTRRRPGSIRKTVSTRKKDYVTMTRKLRNYLSGMKAKDKITQEQFLRLRREIRMRNYRSLAHMKETIKEEQNA